MYTLKAVGPLLEDLPRKGHLTFLYTTIEITTHVLLKRTLHGTVMGTVIRGIKTQTYLFMGSAWVHYLLQHLWYFIMHKKYQG